MAVAAHVRLEDELKAKDSERARRYVATVRPAMAALRFVRPDRRQSDHSTAAGRVATRGGGDTPKVIDVASIEEDYTGGAGDEGPLEEDHEERDVRVVAAEEGETTPDGETLNDEGGTKSIDEVPSEEGDARLLDETPAEEGDVKSLDEAQTEEGGTTSPNEVQTAGCDATPLDELQTEESDVLTSRMESRQARRQRTDSVDEERGIEQPSVLDSMAKVRLATRQTKKEAKRRRVERAMRKGSQKATEVERTVAALYDERRVRLRRQAKAARAELAQRQQVAQARTGGKVSAKVSLVQRTPASLMVNNPGMRNEWRSSSTAEQDTRSRAPTGCNGGGERLRKDAPVECVEGIGGFRLNVLGVWAFTMRNAYGQVVELEACIIEGCADEFLVGVDFLRQHRATMDFECNEVKYFDHDKLVIIPFRTEDDEGGAKVAAVRLVKQSRLVRSAVTPVEVMVTAPDGEEGIFVPTQRCGTVMLAATVTTAKSGKAWIPVINADMQLLKMSGGLKTDKVEEWLTMLGDCETPLDNEAEVRIGTKDPDSRRLVLKLLRAYRKVSKEAGDCPPVTALDVEHHIDTGSEKPIMLKRRRHAQSEDAIMEDNVSKMLRAGVIEEGNGAWGFPVVLVRKRDGEVRFCVDYRALNKVTKRDVYPLPRIDETLEALGGARLFTTLDLKAGYWQISVAPEDRDKIAFTTKQGL
ncbi:hypothetical protein PF005_g25037 [Phytophthora fragariae]|uniref:Reverse transcriptase domain-containing protein n=7 Tax=Phytophthora fragariae TaxID=53985 RepID=A0A6A3VZE9_9STRA|nr:hypothetical protein PF005_g25037 [Phytophthora fragariae]